MKKVFAFIVIIPMMFLLISCKDDINKPGDKGQIVEGKSNILFLVNGLLGDMSFFDSAYEGMQKLNSEFEDTINAVTLEMGDDQTRWETTLVRQSTYDWDLIIVATPAMREPLQRASKQNPNKKYLIFDSEVHEGKSKDYPNVHSVVFKQNEGSFIAGVLAAKISNGDSTIPGLAKRGKVGFIGGMKNEVIYDFALGFGNGIKYENEKHNQTTKMYNQYVGNFFDSTHASSIANNQYANDIDVIFVAASQAGLGVIDSAEKNKKIVIGVDSDQYQFMMNDNSKEKAETIVTSVLKRGDKAIYDSVLKFIENKLEFGTLKSYGIKEEYVGIAENSYYQKIVSQDVRDYIKDIMSKISSGEIEVISKLGMSNQEADNYLKEIELK